MKTQHTILVAALGMLMFSACHKAELAVISQPVTQVSNGIKSDTLSGTIKGTMLAGKTYYFKSDITVNDGDSLVMQAGTKLIALGDGKTYQTSPQIFMHGTFISLGTQTNPNYITVSNADALRAEANQQNYTDVFQGWWGGIVCTPGPATASNPNPAGGDAIIKWTHIELAGGPAGPDSDPAVYAEGDPRWAIYFANITKNFILEDSWVFGTKDDAIRSDGGKISFMRNSFEMCGQAGGEFVNLKSGTLGDVAYNMFVGSATNSLKISNAGTTTTQCNVTVYNNTIINGGFRQTKSGRGGSIDFEKGARGNCYNNLIADSRFGLRITTDADVQNVIYNNQYYYGSSPAIVGQFLSADGVAKFQAGDIYAANAKDNNPQFYGYNLDQFDFVNNPGPITANSQPAYLVLLGNSNFRLQQTSGALNKGKTDFQPMGSVTATGTYGTTITPPGKDIGAYQNDGTGNQH